MRYLLLVASLFCVTTLFAQNRYDISAPPYELAKISTLLSKAGNGQSLVRKLTATVYNTLSLREKFTYNMINGESYSQTCSFLPSVPDAHKKIFARLPDLFGELGWSQRQYDFLHGHRDSVLALIKASVLPGKSMGLNYKTAVEMLNGWELIPFMADLYNTDKKDHDILTVLMLLMKQNKYPPFLLSATYIQLYNQGTNYKSYVDLSEAHQNLIIAHALNFYKSKT